MFRNKIAPKGSGTIQKCGFVAVGVAFGGNVTVEAVLDGSYMPKQLQVSQFTACCLYEVGLLAASPVPCLPVHYDVPPC